MKTKREVRNVDLVKITCAIQGDIIGDRYGYGQTNILIITWFLWSPVLI